MDGVDLFGTYSDIILQARLIACRAFRKVEGISGHLACRGAGGYQFVLVSCSLFHGFISLLYNFRCIVSDCYLGMFIVSADSFLWWIISLNACKFLIVSPSPFSEGFCEVWAVQVTFSFTFVSARYHRAITSPRPQLQEKVHFFVISLRQRMQFFTLSFTEVATLGGFWLHAGISFQLPASRSVQPHSVCVQLQTPKVNCQSLFPDLKIAPQCKFFGLCFRQWGVSLLFLMRFAMNLKISFVLSNTLGVCSSVRSSAMKPELEVGELFYCSVIQVMSDSL